MMLANASGSSSSSSSSDDSDDSDSSDAMARSKKKLFGAGNLPAFQTPLHKPQLLSFDAATATGYDGGSRADKSQKKAKKMKTSHSSTSAMSAVGGGRDIGDAGQFITPLGRPAAHIDQRFSALPDAAKTANMSAEQRLHTALQYSLAEMDHFTHTKKRKRIERTLADAEQSATKQVRKVVASFQKDRARRLNESKEVLKAGAKAVKQTIEKTVVQRKKYLEDIEASGTEPARHLFADFEKLKAEIGQCHKARRRRFKSIKDQLAERSVQVQEETATAVRKVTLAPHEPHPPQAPCRMPAAAAIDVCVQTPSV